MSRTKKVNTFFKKFFDNFVFSFFFYKTYIGFNKGKNVKDCLLEKLLKENFSYFNFLSKGVSMFSSSLEKTKRQKHAVAFDNK